MGGEDDSFDDLFADDNYEDTTTQSESNTTEDPPQGVDFQENNEPADVSWSKAKTGAVAMVAIFLLIIILLTVRSAKISKKSNSTTESVSTESVDFQTEKPIVENTEQTVVPEVQISSESVEVDSPSSEQITTEVLTEAVTTEANTLVENPVVETTDGNGGLIEVNEPALSEMLQTSGIVQSKRVYAVGNSYLYELKLIMIIGENSVEASYFCPKKPYDMVQAGMALNIEYQIDSAGNISISSISD